MAARLYPGLKSLNLVIDTPYDSIRTSDIRDDLIAVKVWYSTTSGFTPPAQGTLAFDGSGLNITISGPLNNANQSLANNTTYYVKYALISSIDPDVYDISTQLSATTLTELQGPPGTSGSNGLEGIRTLTAYRLRSQTDSPLTTAPANTSGPTAPTDYSLTAPNVSVGQVIWYSFGQYNPNGVTVDGVAANTTVWSVPIAASIFQDIRSDNYNGPNPPTTSDFGTQGYYFQRSTGNLYASNAYLRGSLATGTSSQRIEINVSNSNRLKVRNSSNGELVSIGGVGNNTEPAVIIDAAPITDGSFTYGVGQLAFIKNYDNASVPTGLTFGAAVRAQQTDYSSIAELATYYKSGNAYAYSTAVTGEQVNYTTETPSIIHVGEGKLGHWDGSGWCAGGVFTGTVTGNGTVAEVRLADPNNSYAVHIVSGLFRWGSYSISAPPGGTTAFLRADGTWSTPAGGTGTTTNSITFNNSGSGGSTGSTFNGSSALTVSYNTIGAAASNHQH